MTYNGLIIEIASTQDTSNWHLVDLRINGASSTVKFDGTQHGGTVSASAGAHVNTVLGASGDGSLSSDAWFSEYAVLPGALTAPQEKRVKMHMLAVYNFVTGY